MFTQKILFRSIALLFLSLVPVAAITAHASSASVVAGKAVTITTSVAGTAPFAYQWYKDGVVLSGAVDSSYQISSFQASSAGVYSAVISNSTGSTTSDDATLTLASVPSITTQPVSQTVTAGSSVTFSIAASGLPVPTFQWKLNGVNITGATSASLTIANAQAVNAGTYTVVASNSAGSVTSTGAVLTVTTVSIAPAFTTQPVSQTVTTGATVSFSVVASGTPAPTYQWRKNSVNISGATGAAYTITGVATGDAGTYGVVATNSAGTATSSGAVLTVSIAAVAPVITTQPSSRTVTAGTSVTFTAAASGTPAPTYQWRKDGVNLSGATASSYVLASAVAGDAGTYTMVATNSAGSVTSTGALLTVNPVNVAPTITAIADQTTGSGTAVGPLSFIVGDTQTAAGSLTVTGTSSNTALVPNGNIVFGGSGANRTVTITPVAGQTGTTTITVTVSDGALTASDGFLLTVGAQAAATQTVSNLAALSILDAGAASSYPSSVTVAGMGGTISAVTVKLNGFNHAWPSDVDVLLVSPAGQKVLVMSDAGTSATSNATLTFADTAAAALPQSGTLVTGTYLPTNYEAAADPFAAPAPAAPFASALAAFNGQTANGTWSLYVMDDGTGDLGSITGGWTLTVTTTGGAAVAPTISDITSQTTSTGTPITAIPFTVNDTDTVLSSLTLSGSSSNTSLVPAGNITFGGSAANRTITVTPAAGQMGTATITVTVSDGALTATDSFVLTVSAPLSSPVFTTQPVGLAVTAGGAATFSAVANGNPAPAYQWRKNGVNIPGATAASYAIAGVTTADAGTYTVVASNSAGSAVSAGAALTVNSIPVITTQPASQTATAGGAVAFTVAASGSPAPTYQWRKNGVNIGGATGATYAIASVASGDAATYSAVATNIAGTATSSGATLTVNPAAIAPVFTAQPSSQTVAAGASVSFSASASGSPAPSYQWRKNGVNISGATGSTYTIASAATGDAATYSVVATNSAGSATSNGAALTVSAATGAPVITTQPVTQTVTKGSSVTFKVVASSTATMTYQWRKNGSRIRYATGDSYTITGVGSSNAGSYTVVITNASGSVTSNPAVLAINATTAPVVYRVDFNGDGKSDLLWQNSVTGECSIWFMAGTAANGILSLGLAPAELRISGTGDFNSDGKSDVLFQNTVTGACSVRMMVGSTLGSSVSLGAMSPDWQMRDSGDFNGDGKSDIVWQNVVTGECRLWLMAGTTVNQVVSLGISSPDLMLTGTGDFNNDGQSDILWQNSVTGDYGVWLMAGTTVGSTVTVGNMSLEWQLSGTGDFNGDAKSDILCQNLLTGECRVWQMTGTTISRNDSLGTVSLDLILRN